MTSFQILRLPVTLRPLKPVKCRAHTFNHSAWERGRWVCDLEASLVSTVNSRSVDAT